MVSWRDQLPIVRGRYTPEARLADQTWFRVGGCADILFRPADEDDLICFLANKPKDVPVTILGAGSNVLVRDGGIAGIVIRLGRGFSTIRIEEDLIYVGAACLDRTVSLTCRDAGLGGLEFLVGIPGMIGGGVRMNAGAYGQEIKDILVHANALDSEGRRHQLKPEDLNMTYRHTSLPKDWIITSVVLRGVPGQVPEKLSQSIEAILHEREKTQPVRGRTGGSTFKNPASEKAWQLIDAAGCRGLKVGDAQVSEKHCNFLLNLDQATAHDLESLGEEVKRRVFDNSGIDLEWEIIKIGQT